MKVAKVLPYGGERMEGRHRWPESSSFKFRIHTTRLPRRDGVNNSLLSSSLSHTSLFPPPTVSASSSHVKESCPPPRRPGSLIQMKRKQFQVPQDRMAAPPRCSEALGWTRTRPPCREPLAYLHDELTDKKKSQEGGERKGLCVVSNSLIYNLEAEPEWKSFCSCGSI